MAKTKILIVEDEGFTALTEEGQLQAEGYEVVGKAATGEDAIRMADEFKPDAILMDIHLSGQMDGIEAAQQIGRMHDIPVIYVTAYTDKKTLEKARITEPFGYIVKPFTAQVLRSTIEIALYKSRIEQELKQALDLAKRFNEVAENREFRIKELRDEIAALKGGE